MSKFWAKSLMVRLVASFLLLSVMTVSLVATIAYFRASEVIKQSIFDRLGTAATYKEEELNLWVNERLQDLHAVARSTQIQGQAKILLNHQPSEPEYQLAYDLLLEQLTTLVVGKPDLQEIFILADADGKIVLSTNPAHEGEYRSTENYFTQGQLATFVQNVYPWQGTGKPAMTISTPLFDKTGQHLGVVAIHLNLDLMDKIILERAGLGETGETYLVDKTNMFVSGERFGRKEFTHGVNSHGIDAALQGVDSFGLYQNYAAVPVIGVYRWIEDRELALLTEMDQQEAFVPARQLAATIFLTGLISAIILAAGVYFLARQIAHPILAMTNTASQVAAGDLTQTVSVPTQDEIGTLANAFNQMIKQLRNLLNTLEQRVAARTRDLQIAANVSKQITTVLDIDELLQRVVTLTIRSFDLYGCFIYLLDEDNQNLFRAASDTVSTHIQSVESTIPIDAEPSVIALTARTREVVTVNNVNESPLYRPASSLPETQSELAIPMVLGDRLLGVFDLQSAIINRFGKDDLRVLITLAEQVAVAVRNAQLFAEARATRQAAETANRAKSVFLANMSHELRTPLNAILGFSQLMMHNPNLTPDQQEYLATIGGSGEHLLNVINDVLELSKIEAGHIKLQLENFDLHRLLLDLEEMFRLRAEKKGLYLQFEWASGVPQYVRTDQNKLRQVLINLMDNAVKFTEKGGVTLGISDFGLQIADPQSAIRNLQFEVSDTGVGIAPDELDVIFDAFVQTTSGQQSQQGTGLGLSISHQFVRMIGGDITVSSQVGQKTIFQFNVPVKLVDAVEIEMAQSTPCVVGLAPGQPVYRLLVVEDNEANRALLVKLLSSLDFDLREAVNGQEAIEIWQEWRPHLIWMDLRMPVMDGYEATKQIKKAEGRRMKDESEPPPSSFKTVIIALTASAFEEDRIVALEAGCDDFLPKPFKETDVFELMEKHIGVRYVYEEKGSRGAKRGVRSKEQSETQNLKLGLRSPRPKGVGSEAEVSKIATLPPELLANLKQAATQLEMETIDNLIDRIRDYDAVLANGLAALARDFKYDEIIVLIQGARGNKNE